MDNDSSAKPDWKEMFTMETGALFISEDEAQTNARTIPTEEDLSKDAAEALGELSLNEHQEVNNFAIVFMTSPSYSSGNRFDFTAKLVVCTYLVGVFVPTIAMRGAYG